jgi:hypothetical protein
MVTGIPGARPGVRSGSAGLGEGRADADTFVPRLSPPADGVITPAPQPTLCHGYLQSRPPAQADRCGSMTGGGRSTFRAVFRATHIRRQLQISCDLTPLDPKKLRRCRRRQPSLIQILRHLEPRQPHVAHQAYRRPKHSPKNPRQVSFQTGRRVII